MSIEERNAAIIAAMKKQTAINCRTRETARAALIAHGIYNQDGTLEPEFGGPGWEEWLKSGDHFTRGPKV